MSLQLDLQNPVAHLEIDAFGILLFPEGKTKLGFVSVEAALALWSKGFPSVRSAPVKMSCSRMF